MRIDQPTLPSGKKVYIVHHSSMHSLLDLVDDYETQQAELKKAADKKQEYYQRKARPDLDDKWTHGSLKTYAKTRECLYYAQVPDTVREMARKFQNNLMASDTYRQASEKAQSTKRRRVFELDGAELDIDRYLGQQDECWGRVTRGLQRPVVRIAISFMAQAGNDESMFAGVAALGTCCAILAEQAGCSLEIIAVTFTQGGYYTGLDGMSEVGMVLPIKQPEEPLHQESLLICGVPGYFRFYGVHHKALDLPEGKGGHGGASTMSKELKEYLGVQHLLECAWKEGQQQVFLDDFVKTLHDA